MKEMIGIGGLDGFATRFNRTADYFFRYLGLEPSSSARGVIDICMQINRDSSTTQGVRNAPLLITKKQVLVNNHCFIVAINN